MAIMALLPFSVGNLDRDPNASERCSLKPTAFDIPSLLFRAEANIGTVQSAMNHRVG
jgi:hypothetical protein